MTVNDLIYVLERVKDKELSVTLHPDVIIEKNGKVLFDHETNHWLFRVCEIPTGTSGYECEGEVQLIGTM